MWFTGYTTNPGWLRLERSNVGMRNVSNGFMLQGPEDVALQSAFIDCGQQDGRAERARWAETVTRPIGVPHRP